MPRGWRGNGGEKNLDSDRRTTRRETWKELERKREQERKGYGDNWLLK